MRLKGPIGYFVNGVLVPPGTPVEVTDPAEAERLKRLGFVEITPQTEPAGPKPPENEPQHKPRRRSR